MILLRPRPSLVGTLPNGTLVFFLPGFVVYSYVKLYPHVDSPLVPSNMATRSTFLSLPKTLVVVWPWLFVHPLAAVPPLRFVVWTIYFSPKCPFDCAVVFFLLPCIEASCCPFLVAHLDPLVGIRFTLSFYGPFKFWTTVPGLLPITSQETLLLFLGFPPSRYPLHKGDGLLAILFRSVRNLHTLRPVLSPFPFFVEDHFNSGLPQPHPFDLPPLSFPPILFLFWFSRSMVNPDVYLRPRFPPSHSSTSFLLAAEGFDCKIFPFSPT